VVGQGLGWPCPDLPTLRKFLGEQTPVAPRLTLRIAGEIARCQAAGLR